MITNLKDLLNKAKQEKVAIGAFNVYNYETIKAVIESVKETKTPAIIAFGYKYLSNMSLKEVVNLIRTMSVNIDTDIVIHLDHCNDINTIKKAIEAGFTSVMYDGSMLPFEENLNHTKSVVEYAHSFNVSVEAELGSLSLGDHSNEDEGDEIYTDPLQAKEFVETTKVDALAVSIGTVHGMYKGEPKVSVEQLIKIKDAVDIPFVLHGGSGTPEETVKACIKEGITKINVNTEISYQVVQAMQKMMDENSNVHFSQLSVEAVHAAKRVVQKYMSMFQAKV